MKTPKVRNAVGDKPGRDVFDCAKFILHESGIYMRFFQHTLSAGLLAGSLSGFAGAASANENVMVVFDGSNSMWGQIEGVAFTRFTQA